MIIRGVIARARITGHNYVVTAVHSYTMSDILISAVVSGIKQLDEIGVVLNSVIVIVTFIRFTCHNYVVTAVHSYTMSNIHVSTVVSGVKQLIAIRVIFNGVPVIA